MKVAVDGRALRPGTAHRRGVARYLRSLLEALGALDERDEYAVVVAGAGEPEPFQAPNVRYVRSGLPGALLFGGAALLGRPRLDRLAGGCDVVWAPAPAPLAASRGLTLVLTVHDLSFEERPSDYGPYERLWHAAARPARLARRARRVICVSSPVRDAALARWGLDPKRVHVVRSGPGRPPERAARLPPPGAQPQDRADLAAGLAGLPERFVLAVGALEPRKLPGVLVDAHRRARERGLEAGLVFAGDGPLRAELERTQAVVLGHVPDAVLDSLHPRALTLVCASRDEGFGFTPLEALARGIPAIVADLPVFADTLGDGALRVPSGDREALAAALLRLEREPALRDSLVRAGQNAIAELSWERAAQETRAILAEAAG